MFIFWRDTHKEGWEVMAGVLLCITGVEAMYADLGHFSRRAVQVTIMSPCITALRCMCPSHKLCTPFVPSLPCGTCSKWRIAYAVQD